MPVFSTIEVALPTITRNTMSIFPSPEINNDILKLFCNMISNKNISSVTGIRHFSCQLSEPSTDNNIF